MDIAPPVPLLGDAFAEAAEVGALLRQSGLQVAVAESCTGGLLGAALTAIPGSSDYVVGGVIAYSNALKVELLGVPQEILDAYGAVSEECAQAMARGARDATHADVAVAVTGVAGPGGESPTKPAGLIWLALAGPTEDDMQTRKLNGDHGREANRAAAVHAALQMIVDAVA